MQAALLAMALALTASALAEPPARAEDAQPAGLEHGSSQPWLGDLDGMVQRRRIRWLVVPSRTFYFVDKGAQRGLAHDRGRAFEDDVSTCAS